MRYIVLVTDEGGEQVAYGPSDTARAAEEARIRALGLGWVVRASVVSLESRGVIDKELREANRRVM